jgi:undecaprenyl phosphate-alpha-L-ara4N flippase subunit ArnE
MIKLLILILVILSCLLAAVGSMFLKKASANVKLNLKTLFNFNLILGVTLYVISGAMVVALLKFNDLSFIYPLTALTYVFVAVISWKYLDENINIYKIAAIALIVIGVALVAMS